jgi:NTE family protein
MTSQKVSLVLSGGVALGAYQAGACEALHEHAGLRQEHLAASSIGAVNAALIAGGPPAERVQRLREFWEGSSLEPGGGAADWLVAAGDPWRHGYSWLGVAQTRMFGHGALFQPRIPELMLGQATSVYDLAPLRARLERLVDFGTLNGGAVRVSVLTTEIDTGQSVVFDTARGDRIGVEHLLASCGFLPEFPPSEIGGRLLGDGGFAANAPLEPVLENGDSERDLLCFVIDLFCAEGRRPATLEAAAGRRSDLLFGNQTRLALRSLEREYRLRCALGQRPYRRVRMLHLAYRPPAHEAGPQKPFDFTRATLSERWRAGYADMAEAIRLASGTAANETRGERGVALSVWS